jgi:hypothetical protein
MTSAADVIMLRMKYEDCLYMVSRLASGKSCGGMFENDIMEFAWRYRGGGKMVTARYAGNPAGIRIWYVLNTIYYTATTASSVILILMKQPLSLSLSLWIVGLRMWNRNRTSGTRTSSDSCYILTFRSSFHTVHNSSLFINVFRGLGKPRRVPYGDKSSVRYLKKVSLPQLLI